MLRRRGYLNRVSQQYKTTQATESHVRETSHGIESLSGGHLMENRAEAEQIGADIELCDAAVFRFRCSRLYSSTVCDNSFNTKVWLSNSAVVCRQLAVQSIVDLVLMNSSAWGRGVPILVPFVLTRCATRIGGLAVEMELVAARIASESAARERAKGSDLHRSPKFLWQAGDGMRD
jgi:hypothetical protein